MIISVSGANSYTVDENNILNRVNDDIYLSMINKANNILAEGQKNKDILSLYRGENKKIFYKKTGVNFKDDSQPRFDRFFVIGSKAKSYYKEKDKDKNIVRLKQFESDQKAEYIFDRLHILAQSGQYSAHLQHFVDDKIKSNFVKKILHVKDSTKRLMIENYYLAFIHTISSDPRDIKAYSVMISTTKAIKVAAKYSKQGFIIGFWLKKPFDSQMIDYKNDITYRTVLEDHSFPEIDLVNYPDDLEVTVFSAIFPHNIFFVYDVEKQQYIFNPFSFKTNMDYLIENGISVDQWNFSQHIKGIYSSSIWRLGTELLYESE